MADFIVLFWFWVVSVILTASATSVRIVSFNSGLTPKVAYFEERREAIAPALVELNADVLCLQEVWSSGDVSKIVQETRTAYPYSYSALHNRIGDVAEVSSTEAPCLTAKFVFHFLPCLFLHCSSSATEENFLKCAEKCGILDLDQHCISCLIMSVNISPIQRCLETGSRFNIPGLLLLSNLPLEQATTTRFVPHKALVLPRGYISAKVPGVGKVVCTHMTANLGPHYFENLEFDSWQDQSNSEARALLELIQAEARAVVMGDINSSPNVLATHVEQDMEGAFSIFSEAGVDTPYVDDVGKCTWCKYNPLAHARRNLVLDHIFTKNLTSVTSQRIFDDVRVRGKYPLSDHYGIEVTVDVETSQP